MIDYRLSKNKGYIFIFVVFDNSSKLLCCKQIKNKNSPKIETDFSKIITKSKRSPLKLESDRGSEWYISIFQDFLKAKIIHH